jgi:hypothetical protein
MSAILRTLAASAAEESEECQRQQQQQQQQHNADASIASSAADKDIAMEAIIHRVEDGFTRIYSQLEAMDERLANVNLIHDKVDMLEASVRLLENHAFMWPSNLGIMEDHYSPPASSSLSSSSLHSSTVTIASSSAGLGPRTRSLPRRNHTIGSIKYDSSAYKVSFNLAGAGAEAEASADNKTTAGGLFSHIKKSSAESHEAKEAVVVTLSADMEHDRRLQDYHATEAVGCAEGMQQGPRRRKRTASSVSNPVKEEIDEDEADHEVTASKTTASDDKGCYVVPMIIRSQSFSGKGQETAELVPEAGAQHNNNNIMKPPAPQPFQQLLLSAKRSKSLKQPPKSPSPRATRFSWTSAISNHHDAPEGHGHHGGGLQLKDFNSKLRGSVTSLASIDPGSGSTTPTRQGSAFEVSAKDLMARCQLSGSLELKKTTGFKSYKRYWAVLDSNFLYLYGREKDLKAKLLIDVSGCVVTELVAAANHESGSGNLSGTSSAVPIAASISSASTASSGSFRESLKKRGGRSFELLFNSSGGETRCFAAHTKDEADDWMKKIRLAASKVYDHDSAAGHCYHGLHQVVDHVGVEHDLEEEAILQCSDAFSPDHVQQEWRVAFRHSRNPSRLNSFSAQITPPPHFFATTADRGSHHVQCWFFRTLQNLFRSWLHMYPLHCHLGPIFVPPMTWFWPCFLTL